MIWSNIFLDVILVEDTGDTNTLVRKSANTSIIKVAVSLLFLIKRIEIFYYSLDARIYLTVQTQVQKSKRGLHAEGFTI